MFTSREIKKQNNVAGSTSPGHRPSNFGHAALSGSPLFMQRQLGNNAMQSSADKEKGDSKETEVPRLRLKSFNVPQSPKGATGQNPLPDKSTSEITGDQDQSASLTSFATEARGVGIAVEIVGGTSSSTYPDGYRWTQTIDTNVPLGGTTSPYVDPRPNDDGKPFYWTDAEAAASPTTFSDHPSRNAPATGTTTWDAILSLNGVNASTATRLDTLSYGFSIDTAGTVSAHQPTTPGAGLISTHRSTLASEFGGWTFN